ncbi:hypothetical protein AGDE_13364 [Angomonas deanei]|uniref:Uncharacterized protein n=1 Tax=Angomonas deanei TaxID=59799 RepID=A0A7G2C782_9TRYP|nr:hypothetical protein AGDE_13364 [Angomonas deanei]CAD2214667.1 hypothetical protein, conserved [Angomonas deanei]|eukprot:EPY22392.1 hypothetical protein AGDE_13364 [Angomonas deanei]
MIKQEKLRDKAKIDGLLTQLEEKNAQIQDLENEIAESEKTITNLNNQISKMGTISKRRFDDESNSNSPSDSDGDIMREADSKGEGKNESQRPTAEVHRLERENDELVADVDQLEMRIDAFETENARLNRLIKDYEKENKNEGLQRMRNELEESLKTIEILQSENSQLRERLNNMQDSLTFTAALQELCKRVGVTEEEINSLRPQNAASFNEIDTLKEEVNVLKEEVEWLERDRRHWMNKVRLQPLMDTKLRFELGLTSEQLRQLDDLVDRMKEGHLLVEEDSEKNEDYREKYFQELSARRKDAEHFSEFVKSRIDDAIKKTFETTELADITTSINLLKEHIDVISGLQGIEDANSTGHTHSMTRRLDQTALTIRDNSETIIKLREELAAAIAEKDAIIRERDQYREAIFAAAGATSELDNKDTEGIQLSNSRWATLAKALREQLNAKDNLIASLGEKIKGLQKSGNELEAQIKADQTNKENLTKENEVLHDQLSALGEVNEELSGENTSLKKTNKEVTDGIQRLDSGHSRDVLQKNCATAQTGGDPSSTIAEGDRRRRSRRTR